jgi:hypothetical protein
MESDILVFRCGCDAGSLNDGGTANAARRVADPAKPCFSMGFLTGHELRMPEAPQILRAELPSFDVTISNQYSLLLTTLQPKLPVWLMLCP